MKPKRKAVIAANEISEMYTFDLGGYPQKVLIDGAKKSNPVVIFLHGGPGSPIPFCAGCRGMFPELTAQFTFVYWDQLGCGINNMPLDNRFTIDQFVTMTIDLIRETKAIFPEQSLHLFGMSWGSVLAARAAAEVPDLLDSVLIYGQVLRHLMFNTEVYEHLERSGMPDKQRILLTQIRQKTVHEPKDMQKMSGWISRCTEGYHCKKGGSTPIGEVIWGLLTSPDYRLRDVKAIVMNGYRSNTVILEELLALDLSALLQNIQIPYHILQGGTDIVTSTRDISDFVKHSGNPNLQLQVIPDNGHMPGKSGMDAIMTHAAQIFRKTTP